MDSFSEIMLIIIVGVITFGMRASFQFMNVDKKDSKFIVTMSNVTKPAILVGLVIPFAFFRNHMLDLLNIEVLSILIAIPITYITKKFQWAILYCIGIYLFIKYMFPVF